MQCLGHAKVISAESDRRAVSEGLSGNLCSVYHTMGSEPLGHRGAQVYQDLGSNIKDLRPDVGNDLDG